MSYRRKLGIFVKDPQPGRVKTRLVPPLSADQAGTLYVAFLTDLFRRLERLKKVDITVFYAGDSGQALRKMAPERWRLVAQRGDDLGERMQHAFVEMLGGEDASALIIGSDSPDLPIQYIKRAFLRLKHKDVVLGPAVDGGYYLIGLKSAAPALFEGIAWGGATVLGDTLSRVSANGLTLATLPVWYDVDTESSLELLRVMIHARRVEGRGGALPDTERVLRALSTSA